MIKDIITISIDYKMRYNLDKDLYILRGIEKIRDRIQTEDNNNIKIKLWVWTPNYSMTSGQVYTYQVKLEGCKSQVFESAQELMKDIGAPDCFHSESDSDLVKKLLEPLGKTTRRFFSLSDNRKKVIDAK